MKFLNVINMKKIVFPFLGIVMLGLSSCMKPGDNIICYTDLGMPAIVGDAFIQIPPVPIIFTPSEKPGGEPVVVPELMDKLFDEFWGGEAIWSYFCINYDQPSSYDYPTAYDFQYSKIEMGSPQGTTGGASSSNDYNFPIDEIELQGFIKNVIFILFVHKAPIDQKFIYEMTFDKDVNQDDTKMLTLRAKKNGVGTKEEKKIGYMYAINLSNLSYYNNGKTLKASFQYKTGVDEDGKDVYKLFTDRNGNSVIQLSFE